MGHLFDPQTLHQIARRGVGLPFDDMVRTVAEGAAEAYPGHVDPRPDWIFNMAAGAVGVMTVLHASLTEYLIIFGSSVGTGGFSGRYALEIHDFMMAGDMWTFTDDNVGQRMVHRPGDAAFLARDRVKSYRLPEGGWMLEYGRGLVPTALPVGLADAVFSAMDLPTVLKTVKNYGRGVVRELLQGKI